MKLPQIQGNLNQNDFFFYVACDSQYFDDFASSLIQSIEKNSRQGIHIHIFNPRDEQLEKLSKKSHVSFTYEHVKFENFINAAANLEKKSKIEDEKFKYERSLNAMQKGRDKSLIERVMKTYFACARFVRLNQLLIKPQKVFAIDIDAVVRKKISEPLGNFDFFIHHITGKKARFLAGGMFFLENSQSKEYLNEYACSLEQNIENDNIYWSLDQDVLDTIVPKYNFGQLPLSYIDWNMKSDSFIWTAKGERKNMPAFVNEKSRYSV